MHVDWKRLKQWKKHSEFGNSKKSHREREERQEEEECIREESISTQTWLSRELQPAAKSQRGYAIGYLVMDPVLSDCYGDTSLLKHM